MPANRTLRALTLATLLATGAASVAQAAVPVGKVGSTELSIGVHTVGTLQDLDHENAFNADGKRLGDLEPGFQTAWGNLDFLATFGEEKEIEMFFDLYIASRNHPSQTYGHEGYLIVRDLPKSLQGFTLLDRALDHVDLKVGHFEADFGDHRLRRSDNADVQKNPFIGNFVIDPEFVEVGAEVSGGSDRLSWMVGFGNGTNTEDFQDERGTSLRAKVTALPVENLRTSLSYYTVDHSGNPVRAGGGSAAQLYSGNRSGERYGGILGGGQAPGQVLPQAGQDLTAYQLDVTWSGTPVELYASYGRTSDADTNGSAVGSPEESWDYYAAEALYRFSDRLYTGVRYSAADADRLRDTASEGSVQRLQVGGGFWATDNLLVKLEYVTQDYRDFLVGDLVSGVQAWRDPSFDGLVAEVSFSF